MPLVFGSTITSLPLALCLILATSRKASHSRSINFRCTWLHVRSKRHS